MAYKHILAKLLDGSLTPGDFLDRRSVAQELGISPAPVLEAMLRLQEEGFLEALPRRGTRVRLITADYLLGQLLVREALECEASRIICGAMVNKRRRELLAMAENLDRTGPGTVEAWQKEVAFHVALVRLVGNEEFIRAYERVMRIGLFLRINQIAGPARFMSSHAAVVDALCLPDAEAAERAVRAHIRSGKETLFQRLGKAPCICR